MAENGFNVNAKEFVPGLNINAPVFMPKFSSVSKPEPVCPVEWDKDLILDDKNQNHVEQNMTASLESVSLNETSIPKNDSKISLTDSVKSFKSKDSGTGSVFPTIKVDPNRKESVNIVFCGHVDAGKSTIGGHLLFLTGMVDQRTLEKYEREAKEINRESWYLSWALDTNQEERDKGKTVECGRGFFQTEHKHFTLLDAPGHKSFVPNMISGAAQADIAVLVISARRGEFETGFEKGGQTREHATLVKTAGTKHLIVLINKMDDSTVNWSESRYKECIDKLTPFLKKCGFNPKSDIHFMPCSGLNGAWLRDSVPENICPWYRGPTFLDYIDTLPSIQRHIDAPLRLPIADRFRDMGTFVIGKIEAGGLEKGQMLTLMPNKQPIEISQILVEDVECESAIAGDNVKLKIKGAEEEEISSGFVLCHPSSLCQVGSMFDAKIVIKEYKSIICPGYSAVLHLHCCVEEVSLIKILCTLDPRTNSIKEKTPRFARQNDLAIMRFQVNGGSICMETYKDYPQMGRFTLRDEGKTVAVGTISKVFQSAESRTTESSQDVITFSANSDSQE